MLLAKKIQCTMYMHAHNMHNGTQSVRLHNVCNRMNSEKTNNSNYNHVAYLVCLEVFKK